MTEDEESACDDYKKHCPSGKCNPIHLRNLPCREKTKEACQALILTKEQLDNYMETFLDNIQRGLKKTTNACASVKCFPTYVQNLPDGTENGKFLALDLGGSNFRILMITITQGKDMDIINEVIEIPANLMTGKGDNLFNFIAQKLSEFCANNGVSNDNLPLGFTFSFPLVQKGLKVGILERWTKGFNCEGVIGEDVVKLLEEAIERRGDVKVNIVAVLNDTTGTLMACAFKHRNCKIGLIVGTGTNGCYVEEQWAAELFNEPDKGSGVVIINMESGAFGDDGALEFCRTDYDREVDNSSINPGKQLHEKMISGMYLGELVRRVVEKLTNDGIMFDGKLSPDFATRDKFETKFVSEIEADKPCKYANVKKVCEDLGVTWAKEKDYQDLRYICACFTKRAAYLVACSITVLIKKMGYRDITIGIDGTLYKNHPHFHKMLVHKVKNLLSWEWYTFKIVKSEDGSGVGAALVAAAATKPQAGDEVSSNKEASEAVVPEVGGEGK
ncbi:unnamed protein product [Phyllotreta striolata]|uniref:Phosphotransferase n=1 Tax=Phyllotreta striolata TaxID=444603 RepID=A0A9N9TGU2_PHYSR|nr:unnamed protein product [Phyllotreta striolata]